MNTADFLGVVRCTLYKYRHSKCNVTKKELHELIDDILDGEDVVLFDDAKTDRVEDYLLEKLTEKKEKQIEEETKCKIIQLPIHQLLHKKAK